MTGIKGHEELHAHVDARGSGTVWVRAVELDHPGGEADRGVQVPLDWVEAIRFADHLKELADHAQPPSK